MTWQEALESRIEATGHERYRVLCADDHPDHLAWRNEMIRQAGGTIEPPPLMEQAKSAAKAAGQFIASGFALADEAERERRLAICRDCEFYDRERTRCLKCGCRLVLKARLAVARCPINKW